MDQDIEIKCEGCQEVFLFTVKEQEFFREKGYREYPKRCVDCRRKRRGEKCQAGNHNKVSTDRGDVCAWCGINL